MIYISPWRCGTCGHEERLLRDAIRHVKTAHPEPDPETVEVVYLPKPAPPTPTPPTEETKP